VNGTPHDAVVRAFGYGSELIVDALTRAAHAPDIGDGRLVVVDAPDERAAKRSY
jgi:hypothetical protein